MIMLESLSKIYNAGKASEVKALDGVSLRINEGEFVSVMGPSGCGKTTLLNMIGCMDSLGSGHYFLDGTAVQELKKRGIGPFRKKKISFVFQSYALMEAYSVFENIELPLKAVNMPRKERRRRVAEILKAMGMEALEKKLPAELSGGQQQRVAIARALIMDTPYILADEPTGNLDRKTGSEVMDLFSEIHRRGKTIILVTHDPAIAGRTERIIHMCDGRIVESTEYSSVESVCSP